MVRICKDEEKIVEIASWFVENEATIRMTSDFFGIPKSTIHKILTEYTKRIFMPNDLAHKVYCLLDNI